MQALRDAGRLTRERLREEMQIEFTLMNGQLSILDAVKCPRSGRPRSPSPWRWPRDGIITRDEALTRIPPFTLNQLLHRQVKRGPDRRARHVLTRGIAAAPGAATGQDRLFPPAPRRPWPRRASPASSCAGKTSPEDIRGMHPRRPF